MNKKDFKLAIMLIKLVATNKVSIQQVLSNCKLTSNQKSLLFYYCN